MKKTAIQASALILFAVGLAACSDNAVNPQDGNLRVEAAMESSSVGFGKVIAEESTAGSGATVDSLRISSIQLLIRELKLESKGVSPTEIKVKTGPAILSVDSAGARLTMTGTIPSAVYNKIKIKFHPLDDEDRASLSGSPDFADFLPSDRTSVVIKGTAWNDGAGGQFVWRGKLDEELKLDMSDISISDSGLVVIVIRIDPVLSFKESRAVLDPRDPANQHKIEEALKKAIKAIRKS